DEALVATRQVLQTRGTGRRKRDGLSREVDDRPVAVDRRFVLDEPLLIEQVEHAWGRARQRIDRIRCGRFRRLRRGVAGQTEVEESMRVVERPTQDSA